MSLESLINSGRIVDIMVLFVFVEVLALVAYWRVRQRGIPTIPLLANVGAGGSLMLALGASLKGAGHLVVALCLVAALVFHLTDLALRWKR